jgi:CRP-like cAMP-binding protein
VAQPAETRPPQHLSPFPPSPLIALLSPLLYYYRRRHHCRRCGRLFCAACSSQRAVIAPLHQLDQSDAVSFAALTAPKRVCDGCFVAATGKERKCTTSVIQKRRLTAQPPLVVAAAPARVAALPNEWFFVDQSGVTQGPFNTEGMREWHVAGYFKADLMIFAGVGGARASIESWFSPVEDAFTACAFKNKVEAKSVSAAVTSEPAVLPDAAWYYIDDASATQGPYDGATLHAWLLAGYFRASLLVRAGANGEFSRLDSLYSDDASSDASSSSDRPPLLPAGICANAFITPPRALAPASAPDAAGVAGEALDCSPAAGGAPASLSHAVDARRDQPPANGAPVAAPPVASSLTAPSSSSAVPQPFHGAEHPVSAAVLVPAAVRSAGFVLPCGTADPQHAATEAAIVATATAAAAATRLGRSIAEVEKAVGARSTGELQRRGSSGGSVTRSLGQARISVAWEGVSGAQASTTAGGGSIVEEEDGASTPAVLSPLAGKRMALRPRRATKRGSAGASLALDTACVAALEAENAAHQDGAAASAGLGVLGFPADSFVRAKSPALTEFLRAAITRAVQAPGGTTHATPLARRLFAEMGEGALRVLVARMFRIVVPVGTSVVSAGKPSDGDMYVIEEGMFELRGGGVAAAPAAGGLKRASVSGGMMTLKKGDSYGLNDLILQPPVATTSLVHVKPPGPAASGSGGEGVAWVLEHAVFHAVLRAAALLRKSDRELLLASVPLIAANLGKDALVPLADALTEGAYGPDAVIMKEGATCTRMFIILQGFARVVQKQDASADDSGAGSSTGASHSPGSACEAGVLVNLLGPGQHFGEGALLSGREGGYMAPYTVRSGSTLIADGSHTALRVLSLSCESFASVAGQLQEICFKRWEGESLPGQREASLALSNRPISVVASPGGLARDAAAARGGGAVASGGHRRAVSTRTSALLATRAYPGIQDGTTCPKPPPLSVRASPSASLGPAVLLAAEPGAVIAEDSTDTESVRVGAAAAGKPPALVPPPLTQRASPMRLQAKAGALACESEAGGSVDEGAPPDRAAEEQPGTLIAVPSVVVEADDEEGEEEEEDEEDDQKDAADGVGGGGDDDDDAASGGDDAEAAPLDMPWEVAPLRGADVALADLSYVGVLGHGSFGAVRLVRHGGLPAQEPGGHNAQQATMYALKCMRRCYIVEHGWEYMVENERSALAELSGRSPFLITLHNAYADSRFVYLLLELCPGGELVSVLKKADGHRLPETSARFYAASVVEGFRVMHGRSILFRDLKPENLMISASGYCKIVDFGLAKKTSRTFTVCGTPEYMAPESILARGSNRASDCWALGALLWEMLAGFTPFYAASAMDIYEQVSVRERFS